MAARPQLPEVNLATGCIVATPSLGLPTPDYFGFKNAIDLACGIVHQCSSKSISFLPQHFRHSASLHGTAKRED